MPTYREFGVAVPNRKMGFAVMRISDAGWGTFIAIRKDAETVEVIGPDGDHHTQQAGCGCGDYTAHGNCIHDAVADLVFG